MQNIRKSVASIGIIYRKCSSGPELLAEIKNRGPNKKIKYKNAHLCMELFGKLLLQSS